MTGFLIAALAFIVAISVLVAVHEYGHFWVARKLGIKVLRFSIGFGKPIWRKRTGGGETEYLVSAIPLGGYVKMLDERDCDVAPDERHRAFNRQPIRTRVAVLVAGPAFNFLFAILAYCLMFLIGVPGLKPVIGQVTPTSYAAQAGLSAGDEIVSVGARPTYTWEGALLGILDEILDDGRILLRVRGETGGEREVLLNVQGAESQLTEPGALFKGLGITGWSPPAVLGELTPGGPADSAGLLSGDRILSANGQVIENWSQWVDFVRARPLQSVDVRLQRETRTLDVELRIGVVQQDGLQIGRIGAAVFYPDEYVERMRSEQRYPLPAALLASAKRTWDMSALTLRMFGKMIVGDVSLKNISGPINIAQYAGYTASIGLVPFLSFLAIVSISLGILNLLPVPMLDGGQLLYQLIEWVKGSPMSEKAELVGQQIGIAMLLGLMSLAFYNDIVRLMN